MTGLKLEVGEQVSVDGRPAELVQVIDLDRYLVRFKSGELRSVSRAEIDDVASVETPKRAFDDYTPDEKAEAFRWFDAVKPLLEGGIRRGERTALADKAAEILGVSRATVYRRIKDCDPADPMTLLPEGGQGRSGSRLDEAAEAVMQEVIRKHYLQRKQPTPTIVWDEYMRPAFKNAGIQPPGRATFFRRIEKLDPLVVLEAREGKRAARDAKKRLMGSYPFAGSPLSSVQIDYWQYDIEIVDETTRQPIGRPWLAMCIDTFSFMPTGYYLSLDPPGASNAGMAIFHSITRKEKWLAKLGVTMDWPVWGVMKMIHADNAKEFRGAMMQRFVRYANTKLVNRKVKTPRYGPHIERYFGKLAHSVKHLPGATGSNIAERAKKADPRKTARLTLADLELYLLSVIKEHINTPRKELGMSPLEKWRSFFFDTETGRQLQKLPPEADDLARLRKELLPVTMRKLQHYGIQWDMLHYDSEALVVIRQRYSRTPEKDFIVRRDPHDLSEVYVWDEDAKVYLTVPLRNPRGVAMNIWEHRAAKKRAQEQGHARPDENNIFDAHKERTERQARVRAAEKETVRVRRAAEQKKHHARTRTRQQAVIESSRPDPQPRTTIAPAATSMSITPAPHKVADSDDVFDDLDS